MKRYRPASNITNLTLLMPFFEFVTAQAAEANKPIYIADPAHDANFNVIRWPIPAIGGVLVSAAVNDYRRITNRRRRDVSRREFLSFGAKAVSGAALTAGTIVRGSFLEDFIKKPAVGLISEDNFRRTVVSRALDYVGEQSTNMNLLFFYPPIHWLGIKHLLNHRDILNQDFLGYSLFRLLPPLDESFFRLRKYMFMQGQWNLLGNDAIR